MYRMMNLLMLLSRLLYTAMAFDVSRSGHQTCAVNQNAVTCWGSNEYGQLGLGHTTDAHEPLDTAIDLGDDFLPSTVSCGDNHCCSVSEAGGLKCWGRNRFGQLGYGDTANRGDVANQMGSNLPLVNLGTGFIAAQVLAGFDSTCIMSTTSEIKCIGDNRYGQSGYGDTENRGDESGEMGDDLPSVDLGDFDAFKLVVGGGYFVCALSSDGELKCWGINHWGQLGQGDTDYRGDNDGEMGDFLLPIDLGNAFVASKVGSGHTHCCALDSTTRNLKCWGYAEQGQIGYEDNNIRGNNDGEMGDNLPYVNIGTNFIVEDFVAAERSNCVISTEGEIKCFGSNSYGQLGQGNNDYGQGDDPGEMGDALAIVDVGTGFTATEIRLAIGGTSNHYCVYEESSENLLKCWGGGIDGRLGYGDTENRGDGSNEMGDNLPFVGLGTWAIAATTAPITAAPSSVPTISPSVSTTDPVCDAADMSAVNWHDLNHEDDAADGIVHESSVEFDASSLSLTLSVTVEYVGESAAGNLDEQYNLGTTYWIDFGSFQDSQGFLAEPGSCSDRRSQDYTNLTFTDFWGYTPNPDDLESSAVTDRMAYPPSDWTLSALSCNVVEYQRTFSWTELTQCTDGGGDGLIHITQTDDEIVLGGTFFVELVSPYSSSSETGHYRSFSLIQRDFEIALNRQVNVVSSTGVQLFITSILAFGQRDGGYEMLLLVESADFIELGMDDAVTVISSPLAVSDVEAITTGCLVASSFTCAQIFSVIIPANCSNVTSAVDLSGDYQFGFNPQCRTFDDGSTDEACDVFLDSLDDSGKVVLDATSVFVDDCAADLFSVTFDGNLTFYADDGFVDPVDTAFVVGWDTIYGEIVVDIPDDPSGDIYQFMGVSVDTVYVCTSSDPDDVASSMNSEDTVGVGGCLSSSIDSDGPYHVVGTENVDEYEGTTYDVAASNVARFSFLAFDAPRTTISVHVQLLLTLQADSGVVQRRMLLENVDSNQIRHFIGATTVQQPAEESFNVEMVAGTTIGGVALVATVLFVAMLLKQRKEESMQKESEMATAVHVPDLSPSVVAPTTSGAVNV